MAEDFAFGPIGAATSKGGDGLEIQCDSWSQEGDTAKVSGVIRQQPSLNAVKALRDQFQGYGPDNTDEPVIPVTWGQDSTRDGFYRVLSCETSSDVTGRLGSPAEAGGNVAYRWDADLLRVPGWQAPQFEIPTTGVLRVNAHGVASGTAVAGVGLPVGAETTYSPVKTIKSRTSTEGALGYVTTTVAGLTYDYSYRGTAANHYKGSARVEYSPDAGTTWYRVTGRQVINSTTAVRISNGLLRITISSAAVLSVQPYDGAAWDTAKTYNIDYGSGNHSTLGGWVTVMRNDPLKVSVRLGLGWDYSPTTAVQPYLDVTLGRGERYAELYLAPGDGAGNGIKRTAVEAATALTGGIRATANDADTHRYVLALPVATTNDLVNGGVTTTAAAAGPMMVGVELTGSGATGADTAQDLIYEYLGLTGAYQRIVAR